jgi:DNA polymerase III delta prime subunit
MLPKIIVAGASERQEILAKLEINPAQMMGFEGADGKVDDLRHWVNFGVNVVTSTPEISLVVWDADRLSPECQAILLKPLEEKTEKVNLLLMATNENGLLPTILSRCLVINLTVAAEGKQKYWKEVIECLTKGPAKAIDLSEKLTKEEMEVVLLEVIEKLKIGLSNEVSKNRLKVLKLAIDCLAKLKNSNINPKLAFGNFLISSWKLVKA